MPTPTGIRTHNTTFWQSTHYKRAHFSGKRCPFSLQFVSFRNIKGRKSEIRQRTTSQPSATSANRAYNNTCIKPRHCTLQPSTAILSASTTRTHHLHYPTMYFYKKNKPAKTKGYIQSRRQQSWSGIQIHIYRAATVLTLNRSLYSTLRYQFCVFMPSARLFCFYWRLFVRFFMT